MENINHNVDKINHLHEKLEVLLKRQNRFSEEIYSLKAEINALRKTETKHTFEKIQVQVKPKPKKQPEFIKSKFYDLPKIKTDLEKFIGENLINKIGIIITIIGVSIGAKYSIEHDLINPLTRIILGYLAGITLFGISMKLKKNYLNYSAVLISGAIAIIYFITYAAYSFYSLIPQIPTFLLMVVFTIGAIIAAINYNKQIIAHIGLVGAYAVPFLLSENTGNILFLYSYMVIINIGILIIAFQKYWKSLYYSSFGLTWLIFLFWFSADYQMEAHFTTALSFVFIFFVLFYLMIFAYKLRQNEKFEIADISLLLSNSFLFYGIGYSALNGHETGVQFLGLFTLFNAVIHFITSSILYKKEFSDRNLLYLVFGLTLTFFTLAIPVQLDGNWVTLLWVGEAAVLFWIGRTKNISFYEKLFIPIMALAFLSLIHDWIEISNISYLRNLKTSLNPLFNINFLSSVLFIAAFGFINYINRKHPSTLISKPRLLKIISFSIPLIFIFSLYYAFRIEIANYWRQLYLDSFLEIPLVGHEGTVPYKNYDLLKFKTLWILNYSLLFFSLLSIFNIKKIKNKKLGFLSIGLIVATIIIFLTHGLLELSTLRESFLEQSMAEHYPRGGFHLVIRYISLLFFALALFACYMNIQLDADKKSFKTKFDLLLYVSILWIASSELINWMALADSEQSYKLGLSILWGVYALILVVLGIWKSKKHLRIGGIALFGLTLIKLFAYDITHLNTISKTIVFVSLGVLLLVVSFLYNKYKHLIME